MTNERREKIKVKASVTVITSSSYFSHVQKHYSTFYFGETDINPFKWKKELCWSDVSLGGDFSPTQLSQMLQWDARGGRKILQV